MAVEIRDGREAANQLAGLRAKWSRVDTPTMAARGDFVLKQVQTFPWMQESDVALEESGYDQTTIERLTADRRRAGASNRLSALVQAAQGVRAAVTAGGQGGDSIAGGPVPE
jgi:hypothetical protein